MKYDEMKLKICGTVNLGPKWQIVIPKEVRDSIGITQWDSLIVLLKDNKFIALMKNDDLKELTNFLEEQINDIKNNL